MTDLVECSQSGRVLTITFDREPQLNALTHDMYAAVADGLDLAQTDETIRAVVITGKGEAFTAGNDLGEFAKPMPAGKPPVVRFLETLRDIEIPVLAAVNGPAVGVGLTMLLHCDLAFASETATFSAPFTRVGLVPEAGSSLLLPQAVGMAMANDILLAGRTLDADQALSAGLISRVFKTEELLASAASTAQDMADLAPNAMKKSKLLVRSSRDLVIKQMADESRHFADQLKSPEFTESVAAFLEKRSPQFS
ncbi:enoyl-CoA hydratase-related protein [Erythrobacter sp. Alg231-14]|uniref:enoyl-CoA hydratase-related protein n=1 Tax=Erythrobacter sp. Alg231-14 TaxID=1922225 RepID=UPI000D55A551